LLEKDGTVSGLGFVVAPTLTTVDMHAGADKPFSKPLL